MKDTGNCINGLRLIETTAITKKVRRRTHKKRRINKKWAKRYGYREVPDTKKIVMVGGNLYAHPTLIEKIVKDIYLRGEKNV